MALRILIVEDSQAATVALNEWLRSVGGVEVVGSADSEMQATEWLEQNPQGWDVAILDLMINSGSGFNLIRRAKEGTGLGKAVVFSAYATPVVAQKCIQLGADAAFDKAEPARLLHWLGEIKASSAGPLQAPQQ